MRLQDILNGPFPVPRLTRTRVLLAVIAAGAADLVQLALGPLGWAGFDLAIDVGAMVITTSLIGFHLFLLPTFVAEAMPIAGMLPTWTGCVIAVIALRKHGEQQTSAPPPQAKPPVSEDKSYIDI